MDTSQIPKMALKASFLKYGNLYSSTHPLTTSSTSTPTTSTSSRNEILPFLKPAIETCRFFGLFPVIIFKDKNELSLKANRGCWLLHSILIWVITSAYMTFQIVSLIISTVRGHSILQIVAQSLWGNAGLVPYILAIFMFRSVDQVVGIFESWCSIEMDLQTLFCHLKTKKHIRNFSWIYVSLAIISISVCGYHVISEPRNPVYPMHYFKDNSSNRTNKLRQGDPGDLSPGLIYGYAVFQMFIIGWKWAGWAVIEGLCCLFATLFVQCSESVMKGLHFVMTQAKGSEIERLETVLKSMNEDGPMFVDSDKGKNVSVRKSSMPTIGGSEKNPSARGPYVPPAMYQEEYLLFSIRNLHKLASLQSEINGVIGPLLLVLFAQLIVMTCALSFLPIIYARTLEISYIIVFLGNLVTFFLRLVILVMCLGDVYIKGEEVNVGLAKGMNSSILSPAAQSALLAHLTVFSSNPVSFTAWGFFPITRGTLLAAFSLISTYAVIFLQLNI